MNSNILKYILERIKMTALMPFYRFLFKYKMFMNIQLLLRKAFEPMTKLIKSLIGSRPGQITDYFKMGSWLIYKKLLFLAVLLLCIGPFVYFEFIRTPPAAPVVDPNAPLGKNEFLFQDPLLKGYKGIARILKEKKLVYEGDVAEGVCTGNGTLYTLEGKKLYVGGFKNNEYSGKGKLLNPQGNVLYEGDFDANLYHGQGTLYNMDQTPHYTGAYEKGLRHGMGKLFAEAGGGLLYEGAFVQDKYEGPGILYNPELKKVVYDGIFKNEKFHGKGKLYDNAGLLLYEGDFEENLFQGVGTLFNADGSIRYMGAFLKGLKHGAGKLYAPTGNKLLYEGTFALDNYEGNGTLFNPDTGRPLYKGEFKENRYNGEGTAFLSSGAKGYTGTFLNAKIDYPSFIGIPTNKLKEHFGTEPTLYQHEGKAYMSYPEPQITFLLSSVEGDKPPVVEGIVIYDGTFPMENDSLDLEAFCAGLGEPLYEGYTTPVLPEMIALETLAKGGLLSYEDAVMKNVPRDINAYILAPVPEETEGTENLYLKSYRYNGLLLNLFYDKKNGMFLFYAYEKE